MARRRSSGADPKGTNNGTIGAKLGLFVLIVPFFGTIGAAGDERKPEMTEIVMVRASGSVGARNLWPPSAALEGGAPPPADAERKGRTRIRRIRGFLHQYFPKRRRTRLRKVCCVFAEGLLFCGTPSAGNVPLRAFWWRFGAEGVSTNNPTLWPKRWIYVALNTRVYTEWMLYYFGSCI